MAAPVSLTGLLFGLAASSALIIGDVLGAYWRPPQQFVAAALALSSGALITALAFDLFEPAYRTGGAALASVSLFAGAATFTGVKWWLENEYGGSESGPALLANVTLDGIPENLALGVALIGGSSGAVPILVAIFLSNLPEAVGGAKDMEEQDFSKLGAVAAWVGVGVLLAGAVVVGNTVFAQASDGAVAAARSFAGGAVLAGIADEILPDAYEQGGPLIAMATAIGFVVTFLIK